MSYGMRLLTLLFSLHTLMSCMDLLSHHSVLNLEL